jgi:hypothetical protein
MATKKQYQDIKVGLREADRMRLATVARTQERTKTEVAREAIRWYLDNYEEIKGQPREGQMAEAMRYATTQIVKAITNGVDRICAMLARQGRAIGTLYELQYMAFPDPDQADVVFAEAVKKARQKQAKYIQEDEKELIEQMKKVATSP